MARNARGCPAFGKAMVATMLWERIRSALRSVVFDEGGAVTVDWVVLSAAVIGAGLVVLMPIAFQTDSVSQHVAEYISSVPSSLGND